MDRLKQISREYETLKRESSKEMNAYFKNYDGQNFTHEIEKGNLPKWKKIEFQYKAKEVEFVKTAIQYGDENELSEKELVINISNEVLANRKSINHFLLIRLMHKIGNGEGNFCLKTLEKILRNILKSNKIENEEEYYLESFIDIWHHDTNELIPIDILQQIILLDSEEVKNSYGAIIKAVSYLSDHPKKDREKVLNKARNTKKYKEDKYYQEWVN